MPTGEVETSPEADVDACPPNNPSGKKVSLPTGRQALRLNPMTLRFEFMLTLAERIRAK